MSASNRLPLGNDNGRWLLLGKVIRHSLRSIHGVVCVRCGAARPFVRFMIECEKPEIYTAAPGNPLAKDSAPRTVNYEMM